MRLSRALEEKLMDVRLIEKSIAEGKITKADLNKWLSALPDQEGNFTLVEQQKQSKPDQEEEKETPVSDPTETIP